MVELYREHQYRKLYPGTATPYEDELSVRTDWFLKFDEMDRIIAAGADQPTPAEDPEPSPGDMYFRRLAEREGAPGG